MTKIQQDDVQDVTFKFDSNPNNYPPEKVRRWNEAWATYAAWQWPMEWAEFMNDAIGDYLEAEELAEDALQEPIEAAETK